MYLEGDLSLGKKHSYKDTCLESFFVQRLLTHKRSIYVAFVDISDLYLECQENNKNISCFGTMVVRLGI